MNTPGAARRAWLGANVLACMARRTVGSWWPTNSFRRLTAPLAAWMVPVMMRWFAKVTLLVLVLALLVVGMPMGAGVMCPQCVLPTGQLCALAVLLSVAVLQPQRSGWRVRWPLDRLRARLWACPIDHPPQGLLSFAVR